MNCSFMRRKLEFIREKTAVHSRENFSELPRNFFKHASLYQNGRMVMIEARVRAGCYLSSDSGLCHVRQKEFFTSIATFFHFGISFSCLRTGMS